LSGKPARSRAWQIIHHLGGARVERQSDTDRRIDGALADRVAGENAVLRVAPGPFSAAKAARPRCKHIHAVLVLAVGYRAAETGQKIPPVAVMDDGSQARVVVGRVAHLRPEQREVLLEEQADFTPLVRQVRHADLLDKDVAIEVHHVVAIEFDPEAVVVEADARGQRLAEVSQRLLPALCARPGKPPRRVQTRVVHEDAEAARPPSGVVFLADVGEIHVADLVVRIERDQKVAVPDGNISRHALPPLPPVWRPGFP